jgi:hypothetical protein
LALTLSAAIAGKAIRTVQPIVNITDDKRALAIVIMLPSTARTATNNDWWARQNPQIIEYTVIIIGFRHCSLRTRRLRLSSYSEALFERRRDGYASKNTNNFPR